MLVKNHAPGIGEPETIQVWSVVGPKCIHQPSRLKRRQPGIFVEVQCATLNAGTAALITLIHRNLRTALLQQPGKCETAWPSADDRNPLSVNGTHTYLPWSIAGRPLINACHGASGPSPHWSPVSLSS